MRLNPLDPLLFLMQSGTACGHLFAGRYDEASRWAEKALRERSRTVIALRIAAASFALAGHFEEARKATARLRELSPGFRISHIQNPVPAASAARPRDLQRRAAARRDGMMWTGRRLLFSTCLRPSSLGLD